MKDWSGAYRLAALERRPVASRANSEKRPMSSGRTTLWADEDREEMELAAAKGGSVPLTSRMGSVFGVNRPYFHADLAEAVEVASINASEKDKRRDEVVQAGD